MGRREKEKQHVVDWLNIASLGFFLILLGAIWAGTPELADEALKFFQDFNLVNLNGNIFLPAPLHVQNHTTVYMAAFHFCLAFGILQAVILAVRFILHEPPNKKADTLSGVGFWLTISIFLRMLTDGAIGWFGFVGGLVISIGVAVSAGSILKLL